MTQGFAVGWRQVFAMMTIMACSGMVAPTYGLIAVPLAQEFHPSRMVMMLAITLMSLGIAVMSPIIGNLMDKGSLRRIVAVGLAGLVLGYLSLSLVTSFIQVLVVFALLLSASQALSGPMAGTVLLTRWFDKRRGTALGIAISGIGLGTVIFPPLIQFLFDHFAWREALRVLALILVFVTVPALLALVDRPTDRGLAPDGAEAQAQTADGMVEPLVTLSTGQILSDPTFWIVGMISTIILSGMMGSVTNLVPMAVDFGVSAQSAAWIVSLYAATAFASKLSFAALGDRVSPRYLLFAVLFFFAAGMACLARAADGYAVILIGSALVGLGGMMVPLQSFIIPRVFGVAVVGRVLGMLNLLNLCALLATPPLFGRIFDTTGSYALIFVIFAAVAVFAMLFVPKVRLSPREQRPQAAPAAPLAAGSS
jgi:MFS family permease